MNTSFCIAGFGEVMLRVGPHGTRRFQQDLPGTVTACFGGSEANFCVSIACLGGQSRYLTALPDHDITRAFAVQMTGLGCDASHIKYSSRGRLGIYFAERGSNMRGSNVIYDRKGSAVALLTPEEYDFANMLAGVSHLHLSGITPALSENAFATVLAIAKAAAQMNIKISLDLNYRKKLWLWEPGTPQKTLAGRCLSAIAPYAEVIIGNEEDAADVFGIAASGSCVESGRLQVAGYVQVAEKLASRFPRAKFIAITLRESFSADHNNWGGMLYDCQAKTAHFAPLDDNGQYAPYELRNIVDRIGGGDSFCAGLMFALNTPEWAEPAKAIRFAVAASALKHTIEGDFNLTSRDEVEKLVGGATSGRVQR